MKKLMATVALALTVFSMPAAHAATDTEMRDFYDAVGDQVRGRHFDALSRQANDLQQQKARFPDGLWKLSIFYQAVDASLRDVVSTEHQRVSFQNDLENYVRRHAASMNAWLLEANLWKAIGWKARGGGYANTVTPEGWRDFNAALTRAAAILDGHKSQLASNPQWYVQRLDIATGLNEPDALARKIFDEGVAVAPAYLPIYQSMEQRLSPLWHGSEESLIAFINDAGRTPAAASEGLYVRLVWLASSFYPRIEMDTALDWTAMQKSIDVNVTRYPAERNLQEFFLMACTHPDKTEARRLLPLIHEEPSREVLGNNVPLFRLCQDWASGKMASFIMREPETGNEREIR